MYKQIIYLGILFPKPGSFCKANFFFGQAQKVMYNFSKKRFYNLLFDCHLIFSTKLLLLSCYMDVKRALWGFDILNNKLYNIIERLHLRFFKIFQTLCLVPQI